MIEIFKIKQQIIDLRQNLEDIAIKKSTTIEMLEEKRKQDEAKYLHPIIKDEKQQEKLFDSAKCDYIKSLCDELDKFAQGKSSIDAKQILEEYMFITSLDKEIAKKINDKAHSLYKYFLEKRDIESAVTFLIYRSGSVFDGNNKKREKYLNYMMSNPIPTYDENASYILNYGDYREDIIRLFELCGKLDFDSRPKEFDGIYYSNQTNLLLAMGSTGEFGSLAYHIYYCPPFGVEECDRETLMYWHDKSYKELEKGKEDLKEREL